MLRVDVRSKSAKIGLVYWIRGEEDRGKRGRNRRKAVIVGGEVPCSWGREVPCSWSAKGRGRDSCSWSFKRKMEKRRARDSGPTLGGKFHVSRILETSKRVISAVPSFID